jgi:hypothetical protein
MQGYADIRIYVLQSQSQQILQERISRFRESRQTTSRKNLTPPAEELV